MAVDLSRLNAAPDVFIERKDYMDAFRRWIENETGLMLFGDTESIYGTGKTTILRRLCAEYGSKEGWISIWLELDRYSLYNRNHISPALGDWESVEAYLQNLYDYRALLETIAQELARQDPMRFTLFEGQLKKTLEEISDEKFIGFFEELKVNLTGMEAASGQIQIGGGQPLTNETVTRDSWLSIENSQITTGGVTVNVTSLVDAERIKQVIVGVVHDFTEAFKRLFNALQTGYRFVIFGDDYCYLYAQPIGDWFLSLVTDLNDTAQVLSRTVTGKLPDKVAQRAKIFELGNFSQAETREYLLKRLGLETVPDELVEQVFQFSAGNPLVVGLSSNVLEGLDLDNQEEVTRLLKVFKKLPPATLEEMRQNDMYLAQRLNDLLDHIHDMRRFDEILVFAIDLCSVLRQFDYAMLKYALQKHDRVPEDDSEKVQAVFAQLKKYSFVERVSSGDETPRFRLHMFVRELLAQRLEERDPDLFDQLHQTAAEYYASELTKNKEDYEDSSYYEQLYQFEDEQWQALVTEWLYHTSMLRDAKAFKQAQLRLATLYFEAFQWWGWYLDFPLNNQLLSLWEWTLENKKTQTADGEKLGNLLRRFQEAYPVNAPGFAKPAGPHWLKVRSALLPLIHLLRLDRQPLDEEERHLRGLLLEFLGQTYLYSGNASDLNKAEALFKEGRDLNEQDEAEWYTVWMLGYLGEVYSKKNEAEQALKTLAESITRTEEDSIAAQDNELLSRNFSVIGDTYWQQQEYARAFAAYNKSVFFAYAFQWYPNAPDPYTVKYYHAMRYHAAERLLMLYHDCGLPDEARKFAGAFHNFWSSYWEYQGGGDLETLAQNLEARSTERLMAALFPASPTEEELGDTASDTLFIAQTIICEMYQDVESLAWDAD